MTSPDRNASLRKALEASRRAMESGDPAKIMQQLETSRALERELGIIPSAAEERQSEIEQATARIRQQTERARLEGRARGSELFGEGALGRLTRPAGIGRIGDLGSIAGPDALRRATELAEQQARQGLTPEQERIMRERGERQLAQTTSQALRQERARASQAGIRGETRQAREAALLREQLRQQRDLAEGISLADIEQRQQSLQQFGQFAEALGAQDIQRGLGVAGLSQQRDIANIEARFREQEALSASEKFNIGLRRTERERLLTTELANVGLQQATESMGVQRTLQALGLEQAQRAQQQALALQQQEIDKPPPPAPEGGKHICGATRDLNLMSDEIYALDEWGSKLNVSEQEHRGYSIWAKPLAKLMVKSQLLTDLFAPLANAWAQHMSFLVGKTNKDSFLGKIIFKVGKPICNFIGKFVKGDK